MIMFLKRHWFALVMVAGLLARLPQLVMPYWYDEAWTQWISLLPFSCMWAAVAGDVHPVGFFVLTWLIAQVAPWATRLLPLIFSLLAIVLTREIARAFELPEVVQVIAVLLMALTPWAIYFGAELRAYSMLECAVLLGWLAVLQRRWWLLGIAFYAMLQLHNLGFVYAAVIGLYALWQERRVTWWPLLAGIVAIVAYLPTSVLLQQLQQVSAGYWIPRPGLADVLLTFYEFLFLGAHGLLMVPSMAFTVTMLILIALQWRQSPLLLLAAGAPIGLALLASLILPVYLNRTLIGSAPFFYLLIGKVLASNRNRVAVAALTVPLFAVLAISPARSDMVNRYQPAAVAEVVKSAPAAPVYHLGLALLMELHQYALPNPQYLGLAYETISAGHYSPATMQAMGIIQHPVSIAGPTWVIVTKDEDPDAPQQLAAWCASAHCQLAFGWDDKLEPMYGVEVWKLWP